MVNRSQLRKFMLESFNDDELADLVFDYFPNARPLLGAGMTLSEKTRTLIDFADRHGRLDHLIVVIEKLRPEAYCDFFQTDLTAPPEPETAERNPSRIFISYANADAEFASRLAADLRAQSFDIWMAPDSILPGEKWVAAIERGLRESGIFLLLLSPESTDSKWVSQETQVAIMLENEGKMRIYPLRVRRAEVPLLLSTRQHISFEADYDRGLRSLLAVLQPGPAAPPAGEALPRPATAPKGQVITETVVATEFPILIVDWPNAPNQEHLLTGFTTVGRAPDNDVVVNLPVVSGHHLRLETMVTPEGYQVRAIDLGSRNGTYVGGRRLTPQEPQVLEPGDVVNLGDRIGHAISLILRPGEGVVGAAAGQAAPVAAPPAPALPPVPVPRTTPIAAAVVGAAGAVAAPPPPVAAPSSGSPLARVPRWVYAVVGVLALGLLALLLLRPDGGDAAKAAATEAPATEAAVVAVLPTATETAASPTPPPTSTTAPPTEQPTEAVVLAAATEEPATAEPAATAAATAAAEATAEATATAAATATAEAAPALPTLPANFEISSRTNSLGFEALGEWQRDNATSRSAGAMSISDAQAHSGAYAARLEYDFPTGGDDYVTFFAVRPYRIANDRERHFLKVWALSDGARMNLSAIVRDNEGELWKVFLGEINGTEWQQIDGYIGDTAWPSGVLDDRLSGVVEYPIRLLGFLLDDADPSFSGSGAIFLDDVTVE